jgi:hypothetical protein
MKSPDTVTRKCDRHGILISERFLVDITIDIWRLSRTLKHLQACNALIPDEITVAIRRLEHDIESIGLAADDPTGRAYEPGMRVEIVQRQPGHVGELWIIRTVVPGVRFGSRILRPASVVVGRSDAP